MNAITKSHILSAIKEIDEQGIRNGRHSSTYDLIYEGKPYPPKLVISIANRYATGTELDSNEFYGGPNKPAFDLLLKEGFEIIKKGEGISDLINVKEEFTTWLLKKPGVNYFYNVKDRIIQELDKCNSFFDVDIFDISSSNYKSIKSLLLKVMYDESDNDFLKYSEKVQSHLPRAILGKKNYFEFLDEKFSTQNSINYWLYSPGENANKWEEFFLEGIMGLGWDDLGDLKKYDTKEAITRRLQELEEVDSSKKNDSTANYEFLNEMKLGDFVIVKKGSNQLLGYGIVSSDYYYDQTKNTYKSCRKVDWKLKGNWKVDFNLPLKTLTDITKYDSEDPAYDKYYERLLGIMHSKIKSEINVKKEFTNWMVANVSGGNYFINQFSSNIVKLENELNDYESVYQETFNSELFIINTNDLNSEIALIRINIYEAATDFAQYSDNLASGRPKAILGKKNYLRFLEEYFSNYRSMGNNTKLNELVLNQILFGPPGTGKTFNTINEALKIVDPIYFATHQIDRKKLTDRFKELLIKNSDENKGQIAFCTFHQSFSYEDFVEGIKPKTTDTKTVYYDTEPGVFKRICQLADSNNSTLKVIKEGKLSWDEEQFKKASFYKLSLGALYNPEDKPIYEYCRDNGYIAIGFGQENDFTGLSESEIVDKCEELELEVTAAQQMNYFIHYLKKGNYVIIGNGNKYVRAIGKVIGDYEYKAESPIQYNHFRKVEWIFVDENIPIEDIYERGLSQKTMYKIDETALKLDFFTNKGQQEVIEAKEDKKYVLIIDEINRGNVSSIFGELITLIEKDKRAGCEEELEVTLPYSKEPFKVPNNVYLIGTMNTADRSIEALDTALRRRFSFKEFPPKTYLIKTEGASGMVNGMVEDIDLEALLITINNRIEKLIDKDHRIGHSYFLKVDNKEKLIHAFKNEIIPLLEEYFFGDYGKIGLVLGNSFVEKINHDFSFADFKAYDNDIQSDLKEKAVFRITDDSLWNFSTI